MKNIAASFRMLIFMTVLTGVIYPLVVTIVGQSVFAKKANGSLVRQNDKVIGSLLVGQKFKSAKYFWPRPSAVKYNPLPSGGSNLGPTSEELKMRVIQRTARLRSANPIAGNPPQDLLFASGSGLDPDISPKAADYQISRIAKARKMSNNEIRKIVHHLTEPRQLGILGEPRLNVLQLNLALDRAQAKMK